MCRKKYEYQPIGNNNVALVVQEIEIEARRLIIEYQRALLNEPQSAQTVSAVSALESTPSVTNAHTVTVAPQIAATPATVAVEIQGIPPLDAIMPLPAKKKHISMEDVASGKQIHIDEAITEASAAELQTTLKPEARIKAKTDSIPPQMTATMQQLLQSVAPEARVTFGDKWIEFLSVRSERKAEYKARRFYYKALETQINNNVAPLEQLIEFMHKKYGNN